MFKIDGTKIKLTRGDVAFIEITAKNEDGTDYNFKAEDIVRFKVFNKKGCDCIKIIKDTVITEETTTVEVNLSKDDTKIDNIINKPKEYWYEVELNPDTAPQTLIGYDDEGPKLFVLYPEGSEVE
jgi:hypothetical protein